MHIMNSTTPKEFFRIAIGLVIASLKYSVIFKLYLYR